MRKKRSTRGAFVLVEATLTLSLLSVVGLLMLKLSLNILHPRQFALQQVVTDAYLTFERAQAERIPFEDLTAMDSLWPAYPTTAETAVDIGKLPGGHPISGTVIRTRIADPGNYPVDGGTGTLATNPAAMRVWKVQSVLKYEISDRTYLKSRTVIRSQ